MSRLRDNNHSGEVDLSRDELLWLAGFLEGEGCFSARIVKNSKIPTGRPYISPVIQVTSTDEDVLARAARLMNTSYEPGTVYPGRKKPYYARLGGTPSLRLMAQLRPYMGKRRGAKIDEILDLCAARAGTAFGYRCGQAKLTEQDVIEIRRVAAAAGPKYGVQSQLARRFNVSQAAIWYALKRKSWRHVGPAVGQSPPALPNPHVSFCVMR